MKKALNSLGIFAVLGALIFVTSCGDDDGGGINIGDDDGGSFIVANGLYIAGLSGTDTVIVNAARLTSTVVEDEGFGSQERDGFVRGWVYLAAGNYAFAEVDEQEVTAVYGGTLTTETVDPSNADLGPDSYGVVALEENGATFTIANSGVHFISFDDLTDEALIVEIGNWGILGGSVYENACTGVGFSNDVTLTKGESSADGTTWAASGVILRDGEVKFRIDDVWKIDRRETPDNFTAENGYVAFLNVGGETLDVLTDGGANISFTDSNNGGVYDISIDLSSSGDLSATLSRTGDADECAFDPANFDWGIIGAATLGVEGREGWNDHKLMIYDEGRSTGGLHVWRGVFPMKAGEPFKFRISGWIERKSPGGENSAGEFTNDFEMGRLTDVDDGSDRNWVLNTLPGGYIYAVITTDDEGQTWDLFMDEAEWGLIGNGSPVGNWTGTNAQAMTFAGDLAMDDTSVEGTGDFTTDEWKFLINQSESFDYNLGGTIDGSTALLFNSNASTLDAAGNYTITLSTADGGETYTASAASNAARQ